MVLKYGDNLILTFTDYPLFKKDVLYYKDKANKVYVYYDIVTLQYLGYSDNNKEVKQNKNNASIKVLHFLILLSINAIAYAN